MLVASASAAGDLRQLASLDWLAIKPIGWLAEERKGKATNETAAAAAAVGECDERIWHVGGAARTVEQPQQQSTRLP